MTDRHSFDLHPRAAICVIVFFVAMLATAAASRMSAFRPASRVQRRLRSLNKPAVISIESPDGDIIDCIHLSQQPAFDHPMLKDHKIQMRPTLPKQLGVYIESRRDDVEHRGKPQLWHTAGSCPVGTIPVKRTTEDDILRANNVEEYGRKFHHPVQVLPKPASVSSGNGTTHQHAIAYVQGGTYYGAKATVNVWDPSIEVPNEFSLSQIWLLAGSFDSDLNSIEAGWQVSPDLYGDNNTRLFSYWTSDSYRSTGCYNLLCSGFVQVSNAVAMGATISPVSRYDGSQFDISILIWKDPNSGNWWMQYGNSYVLGYWPSSLFSTLSKAATTVEWGGEIVNSEPGGQHTTTQMGSGHFPSEGYGKASYFSNVMTVDVNNKLQTPPGGLSTFTDESNCYDAQADSNSEWGNYFYYGGPGHNSNCP